MRVVRFEHEGVAHYGSAANDSDDVQRWSGAPWSGGRPLEDPASVGSLSALRLLAPVAPSKIVCVGRNYADHVKELGNKLPDEPLIFLKPPSALLAPGAAIVLPPSSQRVEYESEIGVVLGQRLHHASPQVAAAAIFGVTCVNDVTARDLQRKEVQFTRAKGFDTFCPVGPWIQTQFTLSELEVCGRLNGQERQHGRAEQMIFGILQLLSFISHVMTLEPGDLVSTGTPEGVGPLAAGDIIEVEIPGVGVLQNPVIDRPNSLF